jgi:NAD(P)-dependent dehydrogenase (short-subunit alcohol dehydrogenase family)
LRLGRQALSSSEQPGERKAEFYGGHPSITAVVADVQRRYGRIDVLVNNAGHGQVGAAEETTGNLRYFGHRFNDVFSTT